MIKKDFKCKRSSLNTKKIKYNEVILHAGGGWNSDLSQNEVALFENRKTISVRLISIFQDYKKAIIQTYIPTYRLISLMMLEIYTS